MRQFWTAFVAGIFVVAVGSGLMRAQRAAGDDPRIKTIDDASLSGLRTEVPGTANMGKSLASRERELDERELRLRELEQRLQSEEERIKARIDELRVTQDSVEKLNEKVEIADKDVLNKMVKTFEKMAPKKAAGIMATMDDELAVELLMAMKEKNVAQVFEALEPERATKLSSLIAMRRPAGRALSGVQVRAPGLPTAKAAAGSKKKGGDK